jgi:amino acid adenylation domain-containing protein
MESEGSREAGGTTDEASPRHVPAGAEAVTGVPPSLHRAMSAVARRNADRTAVISGNRQVSYRELEESANRLAHLLCRAGVRRDAVVGLLVDKTGTDFVVAILAIWKAGAVYLPIDPRAPQAHVATMLDGVGAAALLGSSADVARFAASGRIVVRLDGVADQLTRMPVTAPAVPASPDRLAYIVHTSGSTGRPKPVAVTHRALLDVYQGWADRYRLGTRPGTWLQAAGPAFDVHVGDVARALLSGGGLVLCPTEVLLDPPKLVQLMEQASVDMVELTPTVWRLVAGWCDRRRRLPPLRLAVAGGEQLTGADHRLLRRVLGPDTRIVNSYGVAEAGIDSTYHEVTGDVPDGEPVPIGLPFPGVGVAVLDHRLRPVAAGTVGELYLTGRGLAEGYYGQPAATAERFVPAVADPPGSLMYRTGDLVRQRADGVLTFVGRVDDEVKVRGARVSLGAVETAVGALPAVARAVVVPSDRSGEQVLTAHVTLAGGAVEAEWPPARIRAELAAHVPAPMVPAEVVVHRRLPIGLSGKADRQAFRPAAAEDGGVAGRGPVERMVVRAWRDVLGRPPDGPETDLFAVGGTSLTAARLAAALAAAGADVPVSAVYAAPTVAGLCQAVEAAGAALPVPRDPEGRSEGPLSPTQHGVWLLHQIRGTDSAYHLPTLLHLTGPLDVPALRAALDHLLVRHDALRTAFLPSGPRQRVEPPMPFPLEVRDGGDTTAVLDELIHRPFDLRRAPLIRGALVRHAPDRHDLAMVAHHLVFDDWSERVFLRELGRRYADFAHGRTPAVEPPAVRFLDVATWHADRLAGAGGAVHRSYWRRQLADLPPRLELPSGVRRAPSGRPAVRSAQLPHELADRVRSVAAARGVTPYVVLLSAFVALLRRWSGHDELVVGAPFGYRDRPETQDLVGFLVSTLPLRFTVPADRPFADLLRTAHRILAAASDHAAVPFDQMVGDSGRAGTDHDTVFRVWFNWLGAPTEPPDMPGLRVEVAHLTVPGALFDLAVYVTDGPAGYRLDLVADPAAVDDRYLAPLLDQYQILVQQLCDAPDVPMSTIPLRSRPVDGPPWTDLRPAPPPPALTAVLAEAAEAFADNVAVRDRTGAVTYRTLFARAAALSTALCAAGVRAGDVVPVYAERSGALVTALLGVLGAGAAFAIVDTAYPAARQVDQLMIAGGAVGVRVGGSLPPTVRDACPTWLTVPGDVGPGTGDRWPIAAPPGPAVAHLSFTSGTGGRPKPVRSPSAALAHFLGWYRRRFRLEATDRFCMLSGLSHDPLLRDLLAPLSVGGTLAVPPDDLLVDPRELRTWLRDHGVTVLHVTPALARIVSLPEDALSLDRIRLVVSAGDALYDGDVAGIRAWAPAATVVNGYGTTETPQLVAFHELSPEDEPDVERIPIGVGAPGAELLVLDGAGRPAAVGEHGQIVVRGAFLADSDGVLPDPVPGHRRFATGDTGRYGPDGTVTMLGRSDDQAQIRGFRVALAEVDRYLLNHPQVRQAACRVLPDPGGEHQLVAYVVPRQEEWRAGDPLRAYLRATLPNHMVPARIIAVPAIPLTPNRKPDRAALPEPEPEPAADAAPRTDLERSICAVWCDVLQTGQVGADQNFFDLGANSILLVRAQVHLEAALARPIPVTALFEHTTVRSLAAYLTGETDRQAPARERRQVDRLRRRRSAARHSGDADADV